MNNQQPPPQLDELVSAYIDNEATAQEEHVVETRSDLQDCINEFQSVRDILRETTPHPPKELRENHINTAIGQAGWTADPSTVLTSRRQTIRTKLLSALALRPVRRLGLRPVFLIAGVVLIILGASRLTGLFNIITTSISSFSMTSSLTSTSYETGADALDKSANFAEDKSANFADTALRSDAPPAPQQESEYASQGNFQNSNSTAGSNIEDDSSESSAETHWDETTAFSIDFDNDTETVIDEMSATGDKTAIAEENPNEISTATTSPNNNGSSDTATEENPDVVIAPVRQAIYLGFFDNHEKMFAVVKELIFISKEKLHSVPFLGSDGSLHLVDPNKSPPSGATSLEPVPAGMCSSTLIEFAESLNYDRVEALFVAMIGNEDSDALHLVDVLVGSENGLYTTLFYTTPPDCAMFYQRSVSPTN